MSGKRLKGAMACYAGLGVIGWIALTEWHLRAVVMVLLAGCALMSYTAYLRDRL